MLVAHLLPDARLELDLLLVGDEIRVDLVVEGPVTRRLTGKKKPPLLTAE